jgi:hypothetical protein
VNQSDPAFSENLRRQLARSDESVCICSVCDEWLTEGKDEDGEPVCEDCRGDEPTSQPPGILPPGTRDVYGADISGARLAWSPDGETRFYRLGSRDFAIELVQL